MYRLRILQRGPVLYLVHYPVFNHQVYQQNLHQDNQAQFLRLSLLPVLQANPLFSPPESRHISRQANLLPHQRVILVVNLLVILPVNPQ